MELGLFAAADHDDARALPLHAGRECSVPVTSTRVVLVRHAEPRAHLDGVVAGPNGCTGLTDTGRSQALAVADRLSVLSPDAVFTSVLRRAIETAALASSDHWPAPIKDCDLCEVHVGQADGERLDSVLERYGYPTHDTPLSPGGESLREFGVRVARTMDRLIDEHRGQTIIVFTHGGFISAACYWFLRIPWLSGQPFVFAPEYTSITEFVHDDRRQQPWTLVRYNDRAHLEPD
jgi:probable phosphoglycerate mutase